MDGNTVVVLIVVFVVLAVIALFIVLAARRRAGARAVLDAMSPEERAHHDAVKAREQAIKSAGALVKTETKARDRRLSQARKNLSNAHSYGRSRVGSYTGKGGSVTCAQHQITTPQGTFPMSAAVQATVDTAGNLATARRASLTRMAAGGLLFGPVGLLAGGLLTKDASRDVRELYLMVDGPGFGVLIGCKPDDGVKVRKLAMDINVAASSAAAMEATRAGLIKQGEITLEKETANTAALDAATAALAEAESNTIAIEAALRSIESAKTVGEADDR